MNVTAFFLSSIMVIIEENGFSGPGSISGQHFFISLHHCTLGNDMYTFRL